MRMLKFVGLAVVLAVFTAAPLFAQEDQEGGKDHPLFTRMPGYFIENYSQKDFDSFQFEGKDGKPVTVEGRKTQIGYRPKERVTVPSPLQIGRNYQNAITKIGGVVLFQELSSGGGMTTLKLVRGTEEIWAKIRIGDSGNNYNVVIVEKAGMQQEVVASADAWKADISATGHAIVYGIYFDTGKAEVKPESQAALQEVAKLLSRDPNLKLLVVGHTDSVGQLEANMKLSQARAEAVVQALTKSHGVAASRLKAQGAGPIAPVATNRTEQGRAKNRRVELVEQ